MIILKLYLHGRPDWHIPQVGNTRLNSTSLRMYADYLREHLYRVSFIVDKLQRNNWVLLESYGAMYYLEYCKFDVSVEETEKELNCLGIRNQLIIEELDLENV